MSTETIDILIIDDDKTSTFALSGYLGTKGYRCAVAESYDEALGWVRKAPPCVILDLKIPGCDSGELLIPEFQRMRANIVIIVVTGVTERVDPERIKKVRAFYPDAVLEKPIDTEVLMSILPTPSSLSLG